MADKPMTGSQFLEAQQKRKDFREGYNAGVSDTKIKCAQAVESEFTVINSTLLKVTLARVIRVVRVLEVSPEARNAAGHGELFRLVAQYGKSHCLKIEPIFDKETDTFSYFSAECMAHGKAVCLASADTYQETAILALDAIINDRVRV